VIGGLIQDQTTETVSKVPLLGDIPLAGNLFKRTISQKNKTELLIFLTPIVAKEAAELTPISRAEEARSNLVDDEEIASIYKAHLEGMKGVSEPNN